MIYFFIKLAKVAFSNYVKKNCTSQHWLTLGQRGTYCTGSATYQLKYKTINVRQCQWTFGVVDTIFVNRKHSQSLQYVHVLKVEWNHTKSPYHYVTMPHALLKELSDRYIGVKGRVTTEHLDLRTLYTTHLCVFCAANELQIKFYKYK